MDIRRNKQVMEFPYWDNKWLGIKTKHVTIGSSDLTDTENFILCLISHLLVYDISVSINEPGSVNPYRFLFEGNQSSPMECNYRILY